MSKRYAYCCGGVRHPFIYLDALVTPDSDAYLNFFQSPGPDGTYHLPNTTTNEGRNEMYERAKGGGYEYIIMMDDDIVFRNLDHGAAFRKFESLLEEFHPAIAVPKYAWHFHGQAKKSSFRPDLRVQGISAADAVVNAFHRDVWHLFFPYWCGGDKESWWNAQQIVHRLSHVIQPGLFVQFNDIEVINLKTWDYPRAGQCRAADLYLREFVKPEWHDFMGWYQDHRSFGHFEPYLRSDYKFSREHLGQRFDLGHEYWRGRV